ncbi:MAG: universal stress protein [Lentisphaeria bacterium]|jgi:nucleotide-binding universal stress UspA family protein
MFEKILVVTNLDEASKAALPRLLELKKLGTRQLKLVHPLDLGDSEGLYEPLLRLSQERLDAWKKEMEGWGFAVETQIPLGLPAAEVTALAAEQGASLVVVIGTAKTLLGDLFLEPLSHAVLHQARQTVLVLKAPATPGDLLAHIFFPTDFSDCASRALDRLRELVKAGAKRLTLCHVQDVARLNPYLTDKIDEFNRIDEGRLADIKAELQALGAERVETDICLGRPHREILNRLAGSDVSLVVMGTQGRGFFGELMLGSVSHYVARHAPGPVLLEPLPAAEG